MKYHIFHCNNGTEEQVSLRATTGKEKAIARARKFAEDVYPEAQLIETSTGCVVWEGTEVYIKEVLDS